jgi:hypothetical protein
MYLKKRCHESQKLCAFAFACPAVASHPLRLREISSLVSASNKTETALGEGPAPLLNRAKAPTLGKWSASSLQRKTPEFPPGLSVSLNC